MLRADAAMTSTAQLSKSVLYAEDDENDTFFMQRAFIQLERPEVLYVVGDGNEAVEYLENVRSQMQSGEHPPLRLLLLDVKMPYRSGLEVLEWVRQLPEFASLLIVMLTSSALENDIAFAAANGANAYLVKPVSSDDLITLIDALLSTCFTEPAPTGRLNLPGNVLPAAH